MGLLPIKNCREDFGVTLLSLRLVLLFGYPGVSIWPEERPRQARVRHYAFCCCLLMSFLSLH